jgi:putative oxygen-independent coproporphyrinogen III oxidase
MTRLFSLLRSSFIFDGSTEITVELNPDDVTEDKLRALHEAGVNRLSIGVQSFDDRELQLLRRRHDAAASRRTLEMVRDAGFANVGIDLIYGLPGQTLDTWVSTLEEGLGHVPSHLSCYQLTIEETTPFGRLRQEGSLKPGGEEKERALFLLTSQMLEDRDFIHYEVSNFAPSERLFSRHNQKYWRHTPYLGVGPAAHSFDGSRRWWNRKSVGEYCRLAAEGRAPVEGYEDLTGEQLRLERLYMGFRRREGLPRADLDGSDQARRTLRQLLESGLVTASNGRIIPTRKGYLVADHLPLLF